MTPIRRAGQPAACPSAPTTERMMPDLALAVQSRPRT